MHFNAIFRHIIHDMVRVRRADCTTNKAVQSCSRNGDEDQGNSKTTLFFLATFAVYVLSMGIPAAVLEKHADVYLRHRTSKDLFVRGADIQSNINRFVRKSYLPFG